MTDIALNEDIKNMEFEQAMKELEDVVAKLEDGRVTLKDSVGMYQRGVALKKRCDDLLEAARLTIKQVTMEGDKVTIEDIPQDV